MSKIRLFGTSSGYVEIAPAATASNNTLTTPSTVGEIIAKDAAGAIGVTSIVTTTATITTAKVGAAVTITESGIEASGIGITCANINGGAISGSKNKIINGDFNFHQRGGTITASSGSAYTLDRWRSYVSGDSPGAFTVQQSTSSYPTTNISGVKDNFKASALITVTSAGSAAANNNVKFQQRMEGNNVYDLAFGTSAAKNVTVSFYVKCSLTGTFGASLVNGAHNRSNIQTYTINSANTWEYKTFTVAGDTSGTWATNNSTGLQLMFDIGSGSNNLNDTTNQWLSDEYHGTTSSVKLTHTNSATIQFAGVQLEAGTQATAFEHRPIGEELELCRRYYQVLVDQADTGSYKSYAIACCYSGSSLHHTHPLSPMMRTTPTLDYTSGSDYYAAYQNGTNDTFDSMSLVGNSHAHGVDIMVSGGGLSVTQAAAALMRTANDNSRIAFSAEL